MIIVTCRLQALSASSHVL